jgi:hypothetical protein
MPCGLIWRTFAALHRAVKLRLKYPGNIAGPGMQPDAPPGASVHCRVMLAAGAPA